MHKNSFASAWIFCTFLRGDKQTFQIRQFVSNKGQNFDNWPNPNSLVLRGRNLNFQRLFKTVKNRFKNYKQELRRKKLKKARLNWNSVRGSKSAIFLKILHQVDRQWNASKWNRIRPRFFVWEFALAISCSAPKSYESHGERHNSGPKTTHDLNSSPGSATSWPGSMFARVVTSRPPATQTQRYERGEKVLESVSKRP